MKCLDNGRAVQRGVRRSIIASITATIAMISVSCAPRTIRSTASHPAAIDLSRLWEHPGDLARRDLFSGPGAYAAPPDPNLPFTFVEVDTKGYSPGFTVRDANGVAWDVKLGLEAQPEVVASRILWAIGYHQPPTYYVPQWTMTGGREREPGPARFRPELPGHEVVGDWSWYENEFIGTQPFNALLVANLILNNWDWKTSNNKVYEVARPGAAPARKYIVRDIGASLGKTTFPKWLSWTPMRGFGQGTRNDLEGFESQGFIKRVSGSRVEFDYNGIHGRLVDTLSTADVVFTCRLLSRLSDAQWQDAFRAAAYPEDKAQRYITKLKAKIAEGLALTAG